MRSALAFPEPRPGREGLRQGRGDLMSRPVVEGSSRPLDDVRSIPMTFPPPREEPSTVSAHIVVEIADRHDDPPATVLMLGAAVDMARGVVGVLEIELVSADLVDRPIEGGQRAFDGLAQRFAAAAMPPAVDVGGE